MGHIMKLGASTTSNWRTWEATGLISSNTWPLSRRGLRAWKRSCSWAACSLWRGITNTSCYVVTDTATIQRLFGIDHFSNSLLHAKCWCCCFHLTLTCAAHSRIPPRCWGSQKGCSQGDSLAHVLARRKWWPFSDADIFFSSKPMILINRRYLAYTLVPLSGVTFKLWRKCLITTAFLGGELPFPQGLPQGTALHQTPHSGFKVLFCSPQTWQS